ncbi:MAG TPA: sulfite exporter TauE/SafE family protein, partial [Gaiellaceae bacterium]|nr:sulfite exporter TauE/SafE family protein [Gaiellaceae bacterium]
MTEPLSLAQHLLALGAGALVGLSLGVIGGGGSILAVPLLLYLVGYHDAHVVIGTTALAVSSNAYLTLIPHARAGHVRWRAAAPFALAGAAAALAGSTLGKQVSGQRLLFLFALLMLGVAVLMLRPARIPKGRGRRRLLRTVVTALGAGLL